MLMVSIFQSKDRLARRSEKQDPTISYLQEMHLAGKDEHRFKVKEWKKIFQAIGAQKKVGVAILESDKAEFKPLLVKRDKVQFILIKEQSIKRI
jgi:hypothetical protein